MEVYQRLEQEWAKFNDLDPVGMVACSSGTAALHLAFEALRLPPGSECICPDFTMIACARAVTLAGLTPVFVDCDKQLLMDTELARQEIEKFKSRVKLVVHIYGRRLSPETIDPLGATRTVEDLAEAHGIQPHSDTDAACWSFYKNKIVAGEEGGAVWFRDPAHATLARKLRSLGFTDAHDFTHIPRGHNYRISNAHAELILFSLANYEMHMNQRRKYEAILDRYCPIKWWMPPREAPWVYDLRIPGLTWIKQCEVVIALNKAGIAARFAFKPMSMQEEYQDCRKVGGDEARKASVEVIYLPLTPGLVTEASARQAFEIIKSVVQ